jgi:hypothetical protein
MKTYNLFLDDIRNPKDCCLYMPNPKFYSDNQFVIVRNYDEFVNFIKKNGLPNIISFDHDLSDIDYSTPECEKTGMDCAKWLVDYCMNTGKDIPDYIIHSMNPVGGKNIFMYLDNYRKFQEKESYDKD